MEEPFFYPPLTEYQSHFKQTLLYDINTFLARKLYIGHLVIRTARYREHSASLRFIWGKKRDSSAESPITPATTAATFLILQCQVCKYYDNKHLVVDGLLSICALYTTRLKK